MFLRRPLSFPWSPALSAQEESDTQKVYDLLLGIPDDEIVTYKQLIDAAGDNFRGAFYAARRRFQREQRGTFRCITNVGYRRVFQDEIEGCGDVHHVKSRRQLNKARAVYRSADTSKADAETLKRLDAKTAIIDNLRRAFRSRQEKEDKYTELMRQCRSDSRQ